MAENRKNRVSVIKNLAVKYCGREFFPPRFRDRNGAKKYKKRQKIKYK